MSSFAGESLKRADIAIFSLHFGGHRIILKGGVDAQIVTDGTTMGPAHSHALSGKEVPIAYDSRYLPASKTRVRCRDAAADIHATAPKMQRLAHPENKRKRFCCLFALLGEACEITCYQVMAIAYWGA